LTSTNERGYQIPFCQCLIQEGFTILHISKHTQSEQGKDIIAIDPDGMVCAYQLKTGDINLAKWRSMQEEVRELVELPVAHPAVDKNQPVRHFFVTNGMIDDPVRTAIDDMNMHWERLGLRNFKVDLILGTQLLRKFVDATGSFFPQKPTPLKDFLELYLADGRGLPDKDKLALFLKQLLGIGTSSTESARELQRRISGAAVITQYLISPFEKERNHIAVVECWIIYLATVLALAEKQALERETYLRTYEIIMQRIVEQLEDLEVEFLLRQNYLEGSSMGEGGIVYKARLTMVLGWVCALHLFEKSNERATPDERIIQLIKSNRKDWLWYWGQSATPYHLIISLFCESMNETELAWSIILKVLADLSFQDESDKSLPDFASRAPDPYLQVEKCIGAAMRLPSFEREDFLDLSYHLAPVVYFSVRRNKRTSLDELWKRISKMILCEYRPRHKWHYLLWQSDEGKDHTWFFDAPQSWKKLSELANRKDSILPQAICDRPEFLYFFLLVYPHRLTSESLRLIDECTPKQVCSKSSGQPFHSIYA
jgi:hypothetical protein